MWILHTCIYVHTYNAYNEHVNRGVFYNFTLCLKKNHTKFLIYQINPVYDSQHFINISKSLSDLKLSLDIARGSKWISEQIGDLILITCICKSW